MTAGSTLELGLGWVAMGFYVVATALLAAGVVFGRARPGTWGLAVAAAGLVPHAVALGIRWRAVGHGPYMLKYEVLSSNAWVAVAVLGAVLAWRRSWIAVSTVVMPIAILSLALGLTSSPDLRYLPPTLQSIWLVFHVLFAKVSAAAFLVSFGAAVLLLLRARRRPPPWALRGLGSDALDALAVRAAAFGVLFWTLTIAAGAIWGNQSWGRYWGWDPVETWSLVSWVVWGSFLHARFFFKLRPTATAWFCAGAFGMFLLALVILPFYVPSLHSAYFTE